MGTEEHIRDGRCMKRACKLSTFQQTSDLQRKSEQNTARLGGPKRREGETRDQQVKHTRGAERTGLAGPVARNRRLQQRPRRRRKCRSRDPQARRPQSATRPTQRGRKCRAAPAKPRPGAAQARPSPWEPSRVPRHIGARTEGESSLETATRHGQNRNMSPVSRCKG